MQIKRNPDGTISATFSEHEATSLAADLMAPAFVPEDGSGNPARELLNSLADILWPDEPEELCPGCVGRGTGEYCVLCNCRIPENLRRKPGSPSEIPAPGKAGQCRCMVPIPHSPVDHEAAQREHSERLEWCRRIVRENPPPDELAGQPCACQNLAGDCDGDH